MSTLLISPFANEKAAQAKRAYRFRLSYSSIATIVALMDAVGIIISSIFGQYAYKALWLGETVSVDIATGIGLINALVYVSLARSAELYRLPRILAARRCFAEISFIWITALLILTALLFLLKIGTDFSRGAILSFSLFQLPLLWIARVGSAAVIGSMIDATSVVGRVAVVIGLDNQLARLGRDDLLRDFGFAEAHRVILDSKQSETSNRRALLDGAMAFARQLGAEEFVIAIGWHESDLLSEVSQVLQECPLPVRLLPDNVIRSALSGRRTDTSLNPMITVEIQRAPMSKGERCAKRLVDIVLAFLAILTLTPIFVMSAIAIKMDSRGPIIFKQRRNGFNQRQFTIYKFRTMCVLEDGENIIQARRKDPRVTRVGRLLRRTSIDELPQLLNVIFGDMSLVGPRPHALAHDDHYGSLIEAYCFRHHVKPGITGWAQIHGMRGETRHLDSMAQRVRFDIWYINNWSLLLDIKILIKTCFEVLRQDAF